MNKIGGNLKPKFLTIYQIYDINGNKVYEPFYSRESAEFMKEFSAIDGQIDEIEVEFVLNKNLVKKGNKRGTSTLFKQ